MNADNPKSRPAIATRLLAGVSVADTPIISRAIEYAREHSEPYLFNHVMRSWLFAVILADLDHSVHDAEILAVTTILHDLGLTKAFEGPLRFEVEGANAARAFARLAALSHQVKTVIGQHNVPVAPPSVLPNLVNAFAALQAGKGACKPAGEGKRLCQVDAFSFLLHSTP